jgi:putative ABC transport system ATP-binding protein/lipoprotein-releasing system ATP-binding protein
MSYSIKVKKGQFIAIMGPSGSGKSTAMNLVGSLDSATHGKIFLDGQDISKLYESDLAQIRGKKIGFIFQSFFLLPTLTVLENTTYFLSSIGLTRSESRDRGEEVLKQVGLLDFKDKLPRDLSGGQRQRVAIARALAKKPRVILADEPTANLDRVTSDAIVAVFQELRRTQKVSFVFSTHDTHLVSYAQEVHRLDSGRLESGRLQARPGTMV